MRTTHKRWTKHSETTECLTRILNIRSENISSLIRWMWLHNQALNKKNSTQSTQYSSPIWIDWVGRRRDTNDGILFPICLSFGNYKFVPFTIKATSILVWLLVMSHRAATVYKNMLIYDQHSVMLVPRFSIQFFAWYQLVFGI